jgi:hypothetical protein
MTTPHNDKAAFHWQTGEPSIFLKEKTQRNQFNGVDETRATMQTRLEPRPLYLRSDSTYLEQPKVVRKFNKRS